MCGENPDVELGMDSSCCPNIDPRCWGRLPVLSAPRGLQQLSEQGEDGAEGGTGEGKIKGRI